MRPAAVCLVVLAAACGDDSPSAPVAPTNPIAPTPAGFTLDTYAPVLGRLPAFLMTNAREGEINAGVELFGGNANGSFLIHTGQGRIYLDDGFLEEILFHEAAHVSLDATHASAPGWRSAQAADGGFVSTYARDNPDREDVAESILPHFAVRRRSVRQMPAPPAVEPPASRRDRVSSIVAFSAPEVGDSTIAAASA